MRSLCELEGIPVQMGNEEFSGVWRLRETQALIDWLRTRNSQLVTSAHLKGWVSGQPRSPWIDLLREALHAYALDTRGAETPVDHFIEWLAEWSREARRSQRGLLLTAAHRAKGLEFDHVAVLDGGWDRVGRGEDAGAPRRLYYVAMTRARQTLTLTRLPGPPLFHDQLQESSSVLSRSPIELPNAAPELSRRYRRLDLRDVFLSFAGYQRLAHPVHHSIAALSPGDRLGVRVKSNRWELLDMKGIVVGRLANNFKPLAGMSCAFATVLSIVKWDKESSEPEYRSRLQSDAWEVVIPELVFEPNSP